MKKITIYTQPDCPPCEYAKLFLQDKGFSFEVKNIQQDTKAKNELIKKYQSYSTPTFVIEDKVITGFDLEQLQQVLGFSD
ncbi:glutaredoxin family protein [Niallia sp. 03133]|uniref:glutaredoxin family protein n=1 Tax=Niallia sp. 03133 TaxID=3458060 RepID=UPI0040443C20